MSEDEPKQFPNPPGQEDISVQNNGQNGQKSDSNNYTGGLDLIKWVYDFVITKEPIAGKFLIFYKKKLDLWVNNPLMFRFFLVPSLLIDIVFAVLMQFTIFFLLSIIVLSLARGLGIFDWLPEVLKSLKLLN
jgi:hypothetical protein